MTKVVALMSMSLDGYVADANDGVDEVFDWYFSGDIEVPIESPTMEMTFRVSPPSAEHLRSLTPEVGAMLTGRRTFDRADGWGGQHPGGPRSSSPTTCPTAGLGRLDSSVRHRRHRERRRSGESGCRPEVRGSTRCPDDPAVPERRGARRDPHRSGCRAAGRRSAAVRPPRERTGHPRESESRRRCGRHPSALSRAPVVGRLVGEPGDADPRFHRPHREKTGRASCRAQGATTSSGDPTRRCTGRSRVARLRRSAPGRRTGSRGSRACRAGGGCRGSKDVACLPSLQEAEDGKRDRKEQHRPPGEDQRVAEEEKDDPWNPEEDDSDVEERDEVIDPGHELCEDAGLRPRGMHVKALEHPACPARALTQETTQSFGDSGEGERDRLVLDEPEISQHRPGEHDVFTDRIRPTTDGT